VLHLYPVLRPTSLIRPVPALTHQTFEPHVAGGNKQIWPDLALFKVAQKDAIRVACQQSGKISLAQRERQIASTSKAQSCTSSLCLPECNALKSEYPSTQSGAAVGTSAGWDLPQRL
jgi:hypothetical protein